MRNWPYIIVLYVLRLRVCKMRSLKFWSKSKENPTVPASSTKDSATYQYKLVLLGETAVGKSCLTTRFCKDVFLDYQDSTIGGKTHTI